MSRSTKLLGIAVIILSIGSGVQGYRIYQLSKLTVLHTRLFIEQGKLNKRLAEYLSLTRR